MVSTDGDWYINLVTLTRASSCTWHFVGQKDYLFTVMAQFVYQFFTATWVFLAYHWFCTTAICNMRNMRVVVTIRRLRTIKARYISGPHGICKITTAWLGCYHQHVDLLCEQVLHTIAAMSSRNPTLCCWRFPMCNAILMQIQLPPAFIFSYVNAKKLQFVHQLMATCSE